MHQQTVGDLADDFRHQGPHGGQVNLGRAELIFRPLLAVSVDSPSKLSGCYANRSRHHLVSGVNVGLCPLPTLASYRLLFDSILSAMPSFLSLALFLC